MVDKPWRDKEKLRELYWGEGLSQAEVADEFGCDQTTIAKWLERHGLGSRPQPQNVNEPWKDGDLLRELYWDEGMTQYEIADELGCYFSTVSKWMDRLGVESERKNTEKLRDESWLKDKYWEERKSTTEIAEDLGCSQATVSEWLRKHGIKTRKSNNEKPPSVYTETHGYVIARTYVVGEGSKRWPIHRLLMIAEEGIDAVKDMEVHHKNGIKWDNRPENLELMTVSEHRSYHATH